MAEYQSEFNVLLVNTDVDKKRFTKAWLATWIEEGYSKSTDDIIGKYSTFDPYSIDYLLVKNKDVVVGTMRIINQNNAVGLPVLNDFILNHRFNEKDKLCEATLLTVKSSERKVDHSTSLLLLIELWKYVRKNDITGIVIAADIRLWYFLKQKLGLCFTEIGERKMYEGSMTIPGHLSVKEQKDSLMMVTAKNILENVIQQF